MAPLYLDVILLSKSVRNCSLFDKALAVCAEEMGGCAYVDQWKSSLFTVYYVK